MLLFKQLIQSSIGYSSNYLYLTPNNPPAIRRFNNIEFLHTKSLLKEEIEEIIKSILKAEEYKIYMAQKFFNTTLNFNDSHQLYIYISHTSQSFKITVDIIINELTLAPEFEKELNRIISIYSKGLILFTGNICNTNTLLSILHQINNNQKKHVLVFTNNKMSIQKANKALISIYNLSQAESTFIKNQSADIVLFSNFNNINLVNTAIMCINMGLSVIAFTDTISCSCALEGISALFSHKKSILKILSTHLVAIITQVFINKVSIDNLHLYEIIECDTTIQQFIREDNLSEIKNSGIIKNINELIEKHQIHYHDVHNILKNLSDTKLFTEPDLNDLF
ncbi:pilus assembly protein PilT [Ehrlichia canis]|uniref:Pilus retraction ATPase PilT n=1 Tax=Ehrlichia canis (strain Jake) TaxID=269484 RepID=A0ACA6AVP0_EHRCJ|nr:pilus assembly protein PilT [Ehrlichia canis]AAZ68276.1 pilus retraction ATPase PilT [Ehrlichia canis str. Jake]AUO54962.1 twitching motility protein PilT [Ehrlichia canis]UKC53282.1 pilus assembly protein PilT [Ehrlichia canis]UKC54219.1 pilus assembly protein PilT [Ehrlichia canis]UKC55155.1 pilus assembly protein PilT [Ehrlichia canis]